MSDPTDEQYEEDEPVFILSEIDRILASANNEEDDGSPNLDLDMLNLNDEPKQWWDNPAGGLTIEFHNRVWRVDRMLVSSQSGWFRRVIHGQRGIPSQPMTDGKPPVAIGYVAFPDISTYPPNRFVLHEMLRFMHVKEYKHLGWGEQMASFSTCVEVYYMADFFEIEGLKQRALRDIEVMTSRVIFLYTSNPNTPLWAKADTEEKQHLRSFLNAVTTIQTAHKWSAKLQKAMYDAGEKIKHRLRDLPEFQDFVTRGFGREFAIAIGLRGFEKIPIQM